MSYRDQFIIIDGSAPRSYEHLPTDRLIAMIAKLDEAGVLKGIRQALADELASRQSQ